MKTTDKIHSSTRIIEAPTQSEAVRRTLTRKDIELEYGMCSRSIRRLELRKLLTPLKLFRKKLYLREDVEACFTGSK